MSVDRLSRHENDSLQYSWILFIELILKIREIIPHSLQMFEKFPGKLAHHKVCTRFQRF